MTVITKLESKTFGDNYMSIKELGRGGMGAVYLARDINLKRLVAVKVLTLNDEDDQSTKEKNIYNFKREAIAIANLNHENIVNIHDMGKENDETHYIVLELIEGQPISKIIKLHPLPAEMVLSIAIQICNALSYVNRNGVIHRDIKPENILLLGKGLAKLTDFGIAKFADDYRPEESNNPGNLIGTILYMSPEQLRNADEVDERADLYSLAVSLYEMLTGKLPFYGDSISEVIKKIFSEEPIPPSHIIPSLPQSVDSIILKALSKDKNDRQSSVAQFEKELRSISEYKSFLEMRDLQFTQDREKNLGGGPSITNPLFQNKSKSRTKNNNDQLSGDVDLTWLDNLDFLMEEDEKLQNEQSILFESFENIIPIIPVAEIKALLTKLKTVANHNEMLNFLNIFDGVKTVKQIIEGSLHSSVFDIFVECSQSNLISPKVAEIINNLNFVVNHPTSMKALLISLRKLSNPSEIINFLDNIDGIKSIKEIMDEYYSIEQAEHFLNLLYECHQQEIIKIKVLENTSNKDVLIGDMLVAFSHVSKQQIKLALSERENHENKLLGEILMKLGFLTREKLLNVLKIQLWYKKLF